MIADRLKGWAFVSWNDNRMVPSRGGIFSRLAPVKVSVIMSLDRPTRPGHVAQRAAIVEALRDLAQQLEEGTADFEEKT